ncbi:hypothetical protein D1871_09335 [Nakamurella silvestris]|nr:hypothetical protein D1871_09335 [Nakamurella silvestris]
MTMPEDPYRAQNPAPGPIPFPPPAPPGGPGLQYPGQQYPGQQQGSAGWPGEPEIVSADERSWTYNEFDRRDGREFGDPYTGPMLAVRPRKVTVAAVLAFISGGLNLLVAVFLLTGEDLLTDNPVDLTIFAVAILVCVLYITGGVLGLAGRDGRLLVIGAGASIAVSLLSIVSGLSQGVSVVPADVTGVVLPIIIITRLLHPWPRAWFRSKGGSTF